MEQQNTLFAALPYHEVLTNIEFLKTNRIGVEIVSHDTNWLLNLFKETVTKKLGEDLRKNHIGIRAAGPLFDLNPGSLDPVVRRHTEHCFVRSVDLTHSVGSPSLVLPSGFNPLLPEESVEGWREISLETWDRVGTSARKRGVEVLIKNVFDHSPDALRWLLESLEGLPFGICLDVGHIHVYSTTELPIWFKALKGHIREIHLHDNLGTSDDHLALGEGIIDFRSVFRTVMRLDPLPPLTFDMQKGELVKSLTYIDRLDLLGLQLNLL